MDSLNLDETERWARTPDEKKMIAEVRRLRNELDWTRRELTRERERGVEETKAIEDRVRQEAVEVSARICRDEADCYSLWVLPIGKKLHEQALELATRILARGGRR